MSIKNFLTFQNQPLTSVLTRLVTSLVSTLVSGWFWKVKKFLMLMCLKPCFGRQYCSLSRSCCIVL